MALFKFLKKKGANALVEWKAQEGKTEANKKDVEANPIAVVGEGEKKSGKKGNGEQASAYHEDEFLDLANLLGKTVKEVKDECLLEEVRKIMSATGRVLVRYAPEKGELVNLMYNCKTLKISEILLSPVYVQEVKKIAKKEDFALSKISAIVDFPFGEGTFSRKVQEVRSLKALGVGKILVMMPTLMTAPDKLRLLKKQALKLARIYKGNVGIAFVASDTVEEELKSTLKAIEKLPLSFITLVFGEASVEQVIEAAKLLVKYKGKKSVAVMGNINGEKAVVELKNIGVDKIYSPYADAVGKSLVERFKVQGVKLK